MFVLFEYLSTKTAYSSDLSLNWIRINKEKALWRLIGSGHRALLVYFVKYRLRRCEVMPYGIVMFCADAQSEVKFA